MIADAPGLLPAELAGQAERVVQALQQEAERYSATGAAPQILLSAARFSQVTDPASGLPGYEGVWRNARNERCGTLGFNGDGSFFAEYDLFCPHPRDTRWFVEMVTAWGNAETIRSEAKLIPAL